MAVPNLRSVCQLRLLEYLISDAHGCCNLESKHGYILNQLDEGAWGEESLALLDRAVKHYNLILTPSVILALLPSNSKRLALIECPLLTHGCLNSAIQRCSHLDTLDLSDNGTLKLCNVTLFDSVLLDKRTTLTTVILENCFEVKDRHVQILLMNAPNLQHLNVVRCDITDNAFLLNQQKQLAREACFQIDNLSWDSKLQTVDVSRCQAFTSTGVRYLCTLCGPTLQNVNLSWTKVDCTALLYLSGMGLPHAVQFFLSNNTVVNATVLESLVYTLHQFDAICEDIFNKWTSSGNNTGQTLGASEENKVEENTSPIIQDGKQCDNKVHSPEMVFLEEIQPELGYDPLGMEFDCVDNSLKANVSSSFQDKNLASKSAMSLDRFSNLTINPNDSHSQEEEAKGRSSDVDSSSELSVANHSSSKEMSGAQADELSSPLQLVSDSQNASAFHHSRKEEIILLTSIPMASCGDEQDSISFDEEENLENGGTNEELVCNSNQGCEIQEGKNNVGDSLCDNDNTNCSHLKNGKCDNVELNTEESDNINSLSSDVNFSVHELMSSGAYNSGGNDSQHTCDGDTTPFSECRKVLKLKGDKEARHVDDTDKSGIESLPLTDGYSAPCIRKYSSATRIRMDFDPNINKLQLNGTVFEDENMGLVCFQMFLKTNKNLSSLSLYGGMSGNFVTDMIVDLVGHYSHKLSYLSIEGCDQVSNIGASSILFNCKQLDTLDLTGVPFICDVGIVPLLECLPLTHLLLAETQITGIALKVMSRRTRISELKELDLSWCEEIAGDESLNKLLELCPLLSRLMLRETPLTADTLSIIAGHCHNLTELSIASNMNNVLDDSVILLSENLPLLEIIDLGWNSHLTNKAIHSLLKNCCRLQDANLEGLKHITSSALVPIVVVPDELMDFFAKVNMKGDDGCSSEETPVPFDILPCLPHRSTSYCTELCHVNLKYSDLVEDVKLQELVTITQGAIKVIDYYGEEVEKSELVLMNLLRRCMVSTDSKECTA